MTNFYTDLFLILLFVAAYATPHSEDGEAESVAVEEAQMPFYPQMMNQMMGYPNMYPQQSNQYPTDFSAHKTFNIHYKFDF